MSPLHISSNRYRDASPSFVNPWHILSVNSHYNLDRDPKPSWTYQHPRGVLERLTKGFRHDANLTVSHFYVARARVDGPVGITQRKFDRDWIMNYCTCECRVSAAATKRRLKQQVSYNQASKHCHVVPGCGLPRPSSMYTLLMDARVLSKVSVNHVTRRHTACHKKA